MKLFITSSNNRIVQVGGNGGNPLTLDRLGDFLSIPLAIALAPEHNALYVASFFNDLIVRARLDGSAPEDLGNPGQFLSRPTDLVLWFEAR